MRRSVTLALAALFSFISPLSAQQIGDFGVGHAEFHHFYQHGENGGPIMRPHQPYTPCCDGDCRPTIARKNPKGEWEALVDGAFERVPPERIKRGITPPDQRPHVCARAREPDIQPLIYCFIEPGIES